jgi:hypothetical protein
MIEKGMKTPTWVLDTRRISLTVLGDADLGFLEVVHVKNMSELVQSLCVDKYRSKMIGTST